MPKQTRTQLPWMKHVKVGSVLRGPNGIFRIVREVTRYQDGDLRSVTVTIRSCSWTHRCYTILNYTDLRILGYRLLRVKPRKLTSDFDRKIAVSIHQPAWERPYVLDCCDVKGVS